MRATSPMLLAALGLLAGSYGSGALAAPSATTRDNHQVVADAAASAAAHAVLLAARSNPGGGYAPTTSACPPLPSYANGGSGYVRSAGNGTLSPNETDYIQRHRAGTQQAWQTWLSSANPGPDLDGALPGGVQNYTSDVERLPRVGIALSGGGYRAMINGAGFISGLDSRDTTAQQRGTAGVLQLSSYASGLSGGSWAVGSFAINDWPTAQELAHDTWDLESDLIVPDDNALSYYASIVSDVAGKRNEGLPTGIVDYWGRALSYHLVNSTYPSEGAATTFADIRNTSNFKAAAYPFPIVIADEREPGELLIDRNTTLFEFTPYEFGSYTPDVRAFVPVDTLGTRFSNGNANDSNACLYGFDNFGFVVGTSSTLFNSVYIMLITDGSDGVIKDALQSVLQDISDAANDVSVIPNPFQGFTENGADFSLANMGNITLVDGGEDNQNIPISALLEPARQLDLILANDNSADVTDFPNGTALHETFLRYQTQPKFNTVPMPKVPSANTFINRGLNTRPTLFGCDSTNDVINADTAANGSLAPIIAYMPNYPYSTASNTSTFQLSYEGDETAALLMNGADVATLGGQMEPSAALYWPRCLACAALERSFQRSNTPRPDACTQCLDAYCWDGVVNDTAPAEAYSPPVGMAPAFVTSNGSQQTSPAYTGGDGSNAGQDSATGSGSPNGGMRVHTAAFLPTVMAALSAAIAMSAVASA